MTISGFGNAPVGNIISVAGPQGPQGPAGTPAVDNADGTVSVGTPLAQVPLSTVAIVTASTAPAIGQTTYYNATSGNLTPPLPALSGLRVGARLAVRRDPADVSQNTVTLTLPGTDKFYSSSATTATFPLSGEQRELQVISVSGTKYWAPAGSVNPIASLDQRYLAGASKLVSIGDNGFGSTSTIGVAGATSTAGTSEFFFIVGVPATNITAQWNHWYTSVLTPWADNDPSGAITFSASLRVVSSTNPGTTTGQIYRLTFNGRTTVTLDPGGRIVADHLGLSLAPGDVVAIRTYLSSGTAYAPFTTAGPYSSSAGGGFTSTTDLTAPGSGTIATSNGNYYGPSILLGQAQGAAKAKSVLLCGDSIGAGSGDAYFLTAAISSGGGFALRALRGVGGLVNGSVNGDLASTFLTTNGSFRRLSTAQRCNSAIVEYGSNDLVASISAAAIEAANLNIAAGLLRLGIGKVFLTLILPRTTSTDGWATTTNQTPFAGESQRVAYNNWVRAGCPINATTLAPVAVGTSGALLAGSFGHPITGFFDTASRLESSLNSGVWLPCARVATGTMTAGSQTLTSSTANFLTAKHEIGGDTGTALMLIGAGASGANLLTDLWVVNSSTQAAVLAASVTAVTNAQLNIGVMTGDGIHPSPHGHYLMSQAINTAIL